jgi:hypothetical protein
MPDAPVTDALVSLTIGVLSVADAVTDSVVDLSAAEPLTALGSDNVRALAEIAINVVNIIVIFVEEIVIAIHV